MSSSASGGPVDPVPRVAVVDADRRVQQSLAEVLRVAGIEVVGTAGDVRSALELVNHQQPSVLLIDPQLPDLQAGSALLSSLELGWPSIRLVVMGWPGGDAGLPGLPASAKFIAKSASADEFVSAAVAACNC